MYVSASGAKELPTPKGTEESPASVEQWETATNATKIANRVTLVNRDWASYWGKFCTKYNVATRPGTKKTGESTEHRRDVELGSLVREIWKHLDVFEKATPKQEKYKQAIKGKICREFGFNSELQEELTKLD